MTEGVLIGGGAGGYWGWAGFRLVPVLGIEATNQYSDLSLERREEWAASAESAWLEAQWNSGAAGDRFEIRYLNHPASRTPRLSCVCLCRTSAATPEAVTARARALRNSLAAGLPPHVAAASPGSAHEVHGWLVPFEAPPEGGQLLVVKRVGRQPTVRRDRVHRTTLAVARYSARRASWEPALRALAALDFPAVLTVGLEVFPHSQHFLADLVRLGEEYRVLSQPMLIVDVANGMTPPDEHAALASRRCLDFARRYATPTFRVRSSLAGARALPPSLGTALAAALSDGADPAVGVQVLPPHPRERDHAWADLATLDARWLPGTSPGGVPDAELTDVHRELLCLADLDELRSVVQLPIAWPGRIPLYADLVVDRPDEPDDDFGDLGGLGSPAPRPAPGDGDPNLLRKLRPRP